MEERCYQPQFLKLDEISADGNHHRIGTEAQYVDINSVIDVRIDRQALSNLVYNTADLRVAKCDLENLVQEYDVWMILLGVEASTVETYIHEVTVIAEKPDVSYANVMNEKIATALNCAWWHALKPSQRKRLHFQGKLTSTGLHQTIRQLQARISARAAEFGAYNIQFQAVLNTKNGMRYYHVPAFDSNAEASQYDATRDPVMPVAAASTAAITTVPASTALIGLPLSSAAVSYLYLSKNSTKEIKKLVDSDDTGDFSQMLHQLDRLSDELRDAREQVKPDFLFDKSREIQALRDAIGHRERPDVLEQPNAVQPTPAPSADYFVPLSVVPQNWWISNAPLDASSPTPSPGKTPSPAPTGNALAIQNDLNTLKGNYNTAIRKRQKIKDYADYLNSMIEVLQGASTDGFNPFNAVTKPITPSHTVIDLRGITERDTGDSVTVVMTLARNAPAPSASPSPGTASPAPVQLGVLDRRTLRIRRLQLHYEVKFGVAEIEMPDSLLGSSQRFYNLAPTLSVFLRGGMRNGYACPLANLVTDTYDVILDPSIGIGFTLPGISTSTTTNIGAGLTLGLFHDIVQVGNGYDFSTGQFYSYWGFNLPFDLSKLQDQLNNH